jgi:hypothetical protein
MGGREDNILRAMCVDGLHESCRLLYRHDDARGEPLRSFHNDVDFDKLRRF